MEVECDEVRKTPVEEEMRSAGEEAAKGLNCAAAEGNELRKRKLGEGNGFVAESEARFCDLVGEKVLQSKDGPAWANTAARPMTMTTPEVTIPTPAPPAQLTIFYGGSIHVFDAIPAEKVHEIMLIAKAAAAANSGDKKKIGTDSTTSSPVLTRSPSLQSTTAAMASPQAQLYPCKLQAVGSDLPIARRHSLQKFFEKRRDRFVSKNPNLTATKTADDTKNKVDIETSPTAGCFEKSGMLSGEFQTNAAAGLSN